MRSHSATSACFFLAALRERRRTSAAIGTGMMPHDADTTTARIALGSFFVTLQPLPPLLDELQPDELLEPPHESPPDEPQLELLDDPPQPSLPLAPPHEPPLPPLDDEPHELSQLDPDELEDEPPPHELPLLSLEQLPVSLVLLPPPQPPLELLEPLEPLSQLEPLPVVSSPLLQPDASPLQPD